MKRLLSLLALPLFGSQVVVTISQQRSPFTLPRGTNLYSAKACSIDPRVISEGQIRQAAEEIGVSFQDPALNATSLASAAKVPNRLLSATKWVATGIAVSAAAITAFKAQDPGVGNARTYGIISAGGGALAAGIPIAQSQISGLQASVSTLTNGVATALLQEGALLAIPANGCSKSVMFFGSGELSKPGVAVIP